MRPGIVVLGATGDLTNRYLLPALAQLVSLGRLPYGLRLVGVGQAHLDTDRYRESMTEQLARHAAGVPEDSRRLLASSSVYVRGDATDKAVLSAAMQAAGGASDSSDRPIVLYLALPHVVFEEVIAALAEADRPPGLRVVVEKPFGEDLQGARRLNEALARVLPEDRVFRVDHFLAKQTVINVLGLRFANRMFEPLWSSSHITAVDIVFDETVDSQDRASYYDRAGALRDMVQNHLLQLLTYVAMEPPLSMDPADLSDRKVDVLRAVRSLDHRTVDECSIRAVYTAGRVGGSADDGRDVAAYVAADGVDPLRQTETYAEVTLQVDNWRWAGVPFRLRTGKALARDRREVVIHFANVPHRVFDGPEPQHNILRLQLDPDRMSLRLNVNGLGDPFDLEPLELDIELARQQPGPYGQLLLAIIEGDTRLSARAAEAEEGWRIVEPVLRAWADGAAPLRYYQAGSTGP